MENMLKFYLLNSKHAEILEELAETIFMLNKLAET
jgi:hypothetical protein